MKEQTEIDVGVYEYPCIKEILYSHIGKWLCGWFQERKLIQFRQNIKNPFLQWQNFHFIVQKYIWKDLKWTYL